jgi:hypothetical protein
MPLNIGQTLDKHYICHDDISLYLAEHTIPNKALTNKYQMIELQKKNSQEQAPDQLAKSSVRFLYLKWT